MSQFLDLIIFFNGYDFYCWWRDTANLQNLIEAQMFWPVNFNCYLILNVWKVAHRIRFGWKCAVLFLFRQQGRQEILVLSHALFIIFMLYSWTFLTSRVEVVSLIKKLIFPMVIFDCWLCCWKALVNEKHFIPDVERCVFLLGLKRNESLPFTPAWLPCNSFMYFLGAVVLLSDILSKFQDTIYTVTISNIAIITRNNRRFIAWGLPTIWASLLSQYSEREFDPA